VPRWLVLGNRYQLAWVIRDTLREREGASVVRLQAVEQQDSRLRREESGGEARENAIARTSPAHGAKKGCSSAA